jgi:hypothetical protein
VTHQVAAAAAAGRRPAARRWRRGARARAGTGAGRARRPATLAAAAYHYGRPSPATQGHSTVSHIVLVRSLAARPAGESAAFSAVGPVAARVEPLNLGTHPMAPRPRNTVVRPQSERLRMAHLLARHL